MAGKVTDPLRSPLASSEQVNADVKINIRGPGRTLQVFAFGQFCMQFETGSQTHTVVGNHQIRMLLKCLVAAPGYRLSREQLCERLWPEHDAVQARDALRQALSRLRRILEPHREGYQPSRYVRTDREMVWLALTASDEATSGSLASMIAIRGGVGVC